MRHTTLVRLAVRSHRFYSRVTPHWHRIHRLALPGLLASTITGAVRSPIRHASISAPTIHHSAVYAGAAMMRY